MFSAPKASTANIASARSRSPLAYENGLRGRQCKSRTRKSNRPDTKSTLSVTVPQGVPWPVSLSSEQPDKKPGTSRVNTPSQEISCSPVTPLPTAIAVFDTFAPLASPPLDGTNITARLNNNHSVQSITLANADSTPNSTQAGPTTPRSRPKPSPIATKDLQRSTSLSHGATINALVPEPMEDEGQISIEHSIGTHLNKEGFHNKDSQSGRDSGIAIESWGRISPEADKNSFRDPKDPFPSFDQLLQSSDFGLTDPFQAELVGDKKARRQRCRSMVYPPILRHQSSMEDQFSRSDAEPSTLNASSMDKSVTTKTVRSKRVASLSFAAGSESSKHFADMLSSHHDLPPRPPTTGANSSLSSSSGMKSSLFYAPLPDSSQDRDQAGYFAKKHNRSASSSSRSSSVSATIPLSRSPSPSSIHHPNVMPFSSMLDLATAKAENITGLYFAKQMNMKSTLCLAPQGLEGSIHGHAESDITIEVNSPSPIANVKHAKDAAEVPSLRFGPLFDCDPSDTSMATLVPPWEDQEDPRDRRRRSKSSTSGKSVSDFAFPPKGHASTPHDTDSTLDPSLPSSTSAQAMRGQHRRSQSASHFFHLSSLKHHSPAQFNLALCYEHGQGGVGRDLVKALYFYQQAADQGHTKASYNLGCICYNLGQADKAIAWFESAGKCLIRGLQPISDVTPHGVLDCPLPKKLSGEGTLLDNDLAEMLRGDHMATSGPFAPYLPAIMCLALLCRQGVQTREGGLVLKKDQAQSVELLKDLLHRASPSMASRSSSTLSSRQWTRESVARSSWCLGTAEHDKDSSSLLSTSCPSLTTCSDNPEDGAEPFSGAFQRSRRSHAPTVEDDEDHGESGPKHPRMPSQHSPTAQRSVLSPLDLGDMHETWAVTLSQHLLKTWCDFQEESSNTSCPSPAVTDKTQQRILRHHLLYITNPTHGKNLYNLGVLYDLYLQDPGVAAKCYRAAYQNSLNSTSVSNPGSHTSPAGGLVTRINSAWNLGVLHVKHKEWKQAQEWFLRTQQDICLHEHTTNKEQGEKSKTGNGNGSDKKDPLSTLGQMSEAFEKLGFLGSSGGTVRGQRTTVDTSTVRKRSLVNVVPHDQTTSSLPRDSPGRRHAREHGLMMHLSSLPAAGSSSISRQSCKSKRDKSQSSTAPSPQNRTNNQEGIRTDANKISWVLRWVESNIDSNNL
ncbi:hypothetical protein BGZ81_005558 [Podila clonocystis]|nr:hypothetical protein BGZ81_005558 [Podila clonocystis]